MALPRDMNPLIAMDFETLIDNFKLYRESHPNLANFWVAYLGLKKRHYGESLAQQGKSVLDWCERGCADVSYNAIVRILLYKNSME